MKEATLFPTYITHSQSVSQKAEFANRACQFKVPSVAGENVLIFHFLNWILHIFYFCCFTQASSFFAMKKVNRRKDVKTTTNRGWYSSQRSKRTCLCWGRRFVTFLLFHHHQDNNNYDGFLFSLPAYWKRKVFFHCHSETQLKHMEKLQVSHSQKSERKEESVNDDELKKTKESS